MASTRSKVTARGRVSIPAEIRLKFGISPGSVLEWRERGDELVVRRLGGYTSEQVHQALFAAPSKQRQLSELKRGIARDVKRRHPRR